jgi:tRNA pseudouridine13 synthase
MNPPLSERKRAGLCAGSALIRSVAADFAVDEVIEFDADDDAGEHLWLRVRKTGENTDHVARLLAQAAGIAPKAVGYAGRKDRHAVTTQWFSLHLPGRSDPRLDALPAGIEILEARRRRRKLQTGGLRANCFALVVREFAGDRELLDARLAQVAADGAPNYFGAQRFGRSGGNLEQARAWFAGERRVDDRKLRGLLLSAARSRLFNEVLQRRVADGSWCRALEGDLMMLDGRGSFFVADIADPALAARVASGDVHPSGALWGRGELLTGGSVATLERAVAADNAALAAGLQQHGLEQERRALRVMPRDMEWEWIDAGTLLLRMRLGPGCFATTILDEVLDCAEPERAARDPSPA